MKMKLGLGLCAAMLFAASAHAQQEGLVNVNISDVTVQIPIGVAANICDVKVQVLVEALEAGPTQCQAGTIALAEDDDDDGGPPQQNGLINVNLTNVDAQVPVAIAANVCGVSVAVLVDLLDTGPVDCTAFGRSATVSQ